MGNQNNKLQVRKESALAQILAKGSSVDLARHLAAFNPVEVATNRREAKDLQYTIESLRDQYRAARDANDEKAMTTISALGQQAAANLAALNIPPMIVELESRTAVDTIAVLILDVADFFNVVRNIEDEDQVLEIASLIVASFGGLSLDHVAKAFQEGKLGKLGKLGKVLDRIDGGVLIGWIHTYLKKSSFRINQQNESRHLSMNHHGREPGEVYRISDLRPTKVDYTPPGEKPSPSSISDMLDKFKSR